MADPAGRELMISCGAAVFTLRVALRYLGWLPRARLFPDPSRPALVARVCWDEDRITADSYEREMYAAVSTRYTHRGGFGPGALPARSPRFAPRPPGRARCFAWSRPAIGWHALAAAVQAGEHALRLDSGRAAELADWVVPPDSPRRDGIPPAAYPAEPAHTEPDFPGRDFAAGHGWGLAAPAAGERSAGVVCLLATSASELADRVAAGQALQRVLLRAAACGVAAALHSQPLELPQLRDFIRVQLAARAHPQLIIRLGVTGQAGRRHRRPPPPGRRGPALSQADRAQPGG